MYIKSISVTNFRRLRSVSIDLESKTTIFVGANNSGKTSAATILRLFVKGRAKDVAIHDFNVACLEEPRVLRWLARRRGRSSCDNP
ncbi:AAA family ATPase [Clavibacter tessellarius]|uniref:AAA family ATPase n=1 Tax=Clavibacter tessellarius TaxID=31965 RepID=UPI0039BF90BE